MPCVDGLPGESHDPEEHRRKADTREDRGKCCEGCALPPLRGLPAFVFMRRAGVRFVPRRFVGLRNFDQWNNSEVLHRKEYEPCGRQNKICYPAIGSALGLLKC